MRVEIYDILIEASEIAKGKGENEIFEKIEIAIKVLMEPATWESGLITGYYASQARGLVQPGTQLCKILSGMESFLIVRPSK